LWKTVALRRQNVQIISQVSSYCWYWRSWYVYYNYQVSLAHCIIGAAAAAAFDAEDVFNIVQVFERRETPGGTWYLFSLCTI
jgi:hypothetical protein